MESILTAVFTNPMVAFVLLIGVVVIIHELGHFLVGRLLGLTIEEFAIGFGPLAWSHLHKGTLYRINWLPLGGYVRFAPHPGGKAEQELYLNTAALYKRSLVSFAGPFFNFILSVIIMIVVSKVGTREPSTQVSVLPNSVAARAGLLSGDTITAVHGEPVASWAPFAKHIAKSAGKPLEITVKRGSETLLLTLTPEAHRTQSALGEKVAVGRIGVTPAQGGSRLSIAPESSLYKDGLRTGDVIQEVEGQPVTYGFEVSQALSQAAPGTTLRLKVYRPAQPLDTVLPGGKTAPDQTAGGTLNLSATVSSPALKGVAGADVVMVGWLPLKESHRGRPALAQWQECGLKKGHAIESLSAAGVTPLYPLHHVEMAHWFDALSQHLTVAAPGPLERHSKVPTTLTLGVRDFAGQRTQLSCNVDAWVEFNHLNEPTLVLALPAQFLDNPGPVKTVLIQSASWAHALKDGWQAAVNQLTLVYEGVRKLVSGSVSLANLGGPVSMAQVAGDAAQAGVVGFLITISLMSINVGLLNLMPLPGLDGGHLLLHAVEGAYGKPLPPRVQGAIQNLGLAIIFLLIIVVFYNDILRFLRR